jgi:hypothetical protein
MDLGHTGSNSDDFLAQHNDLGVQLLNIKVSDKIQVMFNVNDPVFFTKHRISPDLCEEVEEWSRCGSCGDPSKKLKNCDFCG